MREPDPVSRPDEHGDAPAREGEQALWRRWRADGDASARAVLLERHLPFASVVAAIAYRQRSHDAVEFDDYVQFARIGLLESFDRYDPAQGASFRTFASRRMRGAVLDGLERLTERQSQLQARRRMLADRTASVSQADGMEAAAPAATDDPQVLPTPQLFKVLADIGMGLAVGFMLEGTGMMEPADGAPTDPDPPYQALALRQTRRRVVDLLHLLPAQEQTVIRHHYLQGIPFEEIAHAMTLTKGRISQIHKKALAALRALLAERSHVDRSF